MTDNTELRNAEEIAPSPSRHEYATGADWNGLAAKVAANHAARAQAWYRTFISGRVSEQRIETMLMLHEFELATVWWLIANEEHLMHPNAMAGEVLQAINNPEEIGPHIWDYLTEAGIDPQQIEPYVIGDMDAGSSATTPQPEANQ